MTAQAAWLLAILAVIIAGVIGYFVGRRFSADKERIEELESEIKRHQARSEDYRKEVATHFDKTATLFVSMAGSYKELFEHLSSGYEKLSGGSAREILHQRVDALLVGDSRETVDDDKFSTGASVAAAAAAAAVGAASAIDTVGPIGTGDTAGTVHSAAETVAASDESTGANTRTAADEPTAVDTRTAADATNAVDTRSAADTPTAASETFTHVAPKSEELRIEPFASVPYDVAAETALVSDAPAEPLSADEPIAIEPITTEPIAVGPRREEAALVGDPLAEEVLGADRATPPRENTR